MVQTETIILCVGFLLVLDMVESLLYMLVCEVMPLSSAICHLTPALFTCKRTSSCPTHRLRRMAILYTPSCQSENSLFE